MNKKIDLVVPDECLSMIDCWEAIVTILFVNFNKDRDSICVSSDFYYDNLEPINRELTLEEIFRKTMFLYNKEVIEESLWFYEYFYSIKLEIVNKESIVEMKTVIQEELHDNNPVIIFVDTYHCNFNKMYQKYHYFHAFIISGIDGNKLIVTDPTQHMENLEVDIDDVHLCTENLLKIRKLNDDKIWDPEYLIKYNFVKSNFRSTNTQTARIKNIEAFFKDIMKSKSEIFRSFERSEESLSILFTWLLKNIALNIKKSSIFIEKAYSQEALHLLSMLKDSHNSWMLAGRIFMKMYYANERIRGELFDKFCDLANDIITLEKVIIKEFISLLNLGDIRLEEDLYGNYLSAAFEGSRT
ncbi:hypothetical protein CON32_23540 [Bacillus cereus]|nr:hypothetical protein CON32_23540 [Bacillus cereus]